MIDTQKIIALAESRLAGTDMFVVSCTCTAGNDIELLIDSDTSVDIDTCADLNRAIEEVLDRDNEDFSLTVASAGIGSELKQLRQYRKLIGRSVEVRRGQEAQAERHGEPHLPLHRGQIHQGVSRFQIAPEPPRLHEAD